YPQPDVRGTGSDELRNRIAGDSKRETSGHHGVDADDVPARVGQRAAGIPGCEANGGLHPSFGAEARQRAESMDDARGQCPDKPERITDGDGELSRAQARGVGRGCRGQAGGGDAQRGEIATTVARDNPGFERAAIPEFDCETRAARPQGIGTSDVRVGDQEAVVAPDDARSRTTAPGMNHNCGAAKTLGDFAKTVWRHLSGSAGNARRRQWPSPSGRRHESTARAAACRWSSNPDVAERLPHPRAVCLLARPEYRQARLPPALRDRWAPVRQPSLPPTQKGSVGGEDPLASGQLAVPRRESRAGCGPSRAGPRRRDSRLEWGWPRRRKA